MLEELQTVLPPPAKPIESVADMARWNEVFAAVGSRLPEQYVQFIQKYGTGTINGFLRILSPFAKNRYVNLREQLPAMLSTLRAVKLGDPDGCPYPLWFEPGGLLPFGSTDNGQQLCWRTGSERPLGGDEMVDDWTVVVISERDPEHEHLEIGFERFLVEVLTKKGRCSLFPDLADEPAAFRPAEPK